MLHFGFCLVYQDKEERYKHNTEYNGKYHSEENTRTDGLTEPGPLANTIGSIPNTKAREVIRIGRKRSWAAWMADCIKSPPLSTCTLANSTIKMAFFAASPTSITKPIWK